MIHTGTWIGGEARSAFYDLQRIQHARRNAVHVLDQFHTPVPPITCPSRACPLRYTPSPSLHLSSSLFPTAIFVM